MDAFAERIGKEIERLIRAEGGTHPGIGQVGVAVFRVGRDLRYQWAYDPRFDDQAMRDGMLGKCNHDLFVAEDAERIQIPALEVSDTGLVEGKVMSHAEHHRELGELGNLQAGRAVT